jgi:molecular chaperone DnaK
MGYVLGVDLGTTFTAAALRRGGRSEVVALGADAFEMPSVALLRADGQLVVGEEAERLATDQPNRIAREFKRRLGDPTPLLLGGTPFPVHSLTARLLRAVVEQVTAQQGAAPDRVAVTRPANWGRHKQEMLGRAVAEALQVPSLVITEPEAAAIHYASTGHAGPGEVVTVYDLGGGTFDVTVMVSTGSRFTLAGLPAGLEQLGGVDFDDAIFGFVVEHLDEAFAQLDPDDPEVIGALARLRRDCVQAKVALSADTEATIPVSLPAVDTQVRVTRAEFERLIRPALQETIDLTGRALETAGVARADLTAFLLVGGSSRIPLVGQLLSETFDRPVVMEVHPKHSIALGAAALADPTAKLGPTNLYEATLKPATPSTLDAGGDEPPRPARPPRPTVPPPPPRPPAAAPPATAPPATGPPAFGEPRPAAAAPDPSPQPAAAPARAPAPVLPGGVAPRSRGRLVGVALVVAVVLVGAALLVRSLAAGDDDDGSDVTVEDPGDPADPADDPTTTSTTAVESVPTPSSVPIPTGAPLPDDLLVFTRFDGTAANVCSLSAGGGEPACVTAVDPSRAMLPALSPDRASIAYTLDAGGAWELWLIDTDGTAPQQVAVDLAEGARAAWSPDGTRLAFVAVRAGRPDLVVLDLATGEERALTADDAVEADPDWSADDLVAYAAGGDLFVVPGSGGDPVQLTDHPADDGHPSWSPDGTRLAFSSARSGNADIYVMSAEGAGQFPLTDDPGADVRPTWSGDGGRLAFETTRDAPDRADVAELWVMGADGEGETRLTTRDGLDAHPAWS